MENLENSLPTQPSAEGRAENITPAADTSFFAKLKGNWPVWISIGIVSVAVISFIFYAAYSYSNRRQKVQPTPTFTPTLIPTPTPAPETSPSPTVDETASWETYTNNNHGYSIKYPPEFTLQEWPALGTEGDKYKGQEICMKLYLENATKALVTSISIASPDIAGKDIMCFRSGVGVNAETYNEQVEADGKAYLAEGVRDYKTTSGKNVYIGETLHVQFENGFMIEYSGTTLGDAKFEDYLSIKPAILKILSTFKFLE